MDEIKAQINWKNLRVDTIPSRPFIYRRFVEMAKKIGISNPELSVGAYRDGIPNAECLDERKIAISKKMLELLDDREVVAILAHELGHSKHAMKHRFITIAPLAGTAGGGILGYLLASKLLTTDDDQRSTRRDILKSAVTVAAAWAGKRIGDLGPVYKEYEADEEAVELSGDKDAVISGMKKLEKWCRENDELARATAEATRIERLFYPQRGGR